MRVAGGGADGARLRALIVLLRRAGLRIREALELAETDLETTRGAVIVPAAQPSARGSRRGTRRQAESPTTQAATYTAPAERSARSVAAGPTGRCAVFDSGRWPRQSPQIPGTATFVKMCGDATELSG